MAFVITDPCIGTKDAACVDVCPVDCIHPRKDEPEFATTTMLYIHPEECIDCGACVPACPVAAIYDSPESTPDEPEGAGRRQRDVSRGRRGGLRGRRGDRPGARGGALRFDGGGAGRTRRRAREVDSNPNPNVIWDSGFGICDPSKSGRVMARGWESKAIESQQESATAAQQPIGPAVSTAEASRRSTYATLMLARTRALADLQSACAPAHRGMLEQMIAELDQRIAGLGKT